MPETNSVKVGSDTTEHAMAEKTGFLEKLLAICGAVTVIVAAIAQAAANLLGEDAKIVIICGTILGVSGAIGAALTSLGYSKSRAEVKAAASLSEKKDS